MGNSRRGVLWGIVLVAALSAGWGCGTRAPDRALDREIGRYDLVAGTQTILPAYGFTGEDRLLETARAIRRLGSNTLKMALTARYCTVEYH
ncbi:MAG TPA: hypothetical protein ENK19_06000, partial [Acidobacteria bacterium]|nr:hypothetical protein [Acidobacteriota bacterium]